MPVHNPVTFDYTIRPYRRMFFCLSLFSYYQNYHVLLNPIGVSVLFFQINSIPYVKFHLSTTLTVSVQNNVTSIKQACHLLSRLIVTITTNNEVVCISSVCAHLCKCTSARFFSRARVRFSCECTSYLCTNDFVMSVI